MKPPTIIFNLLALLLSILLGGGCANVSYMSNQTSLAVSAETASNPSQPVSLIFGFDRRSLVAVPPKVPAVSPVGVHTGEVLSTVGILKVEPTEKCKDPEKISPWDITVSSFSITGEAADLATRKKRPDEATVKIAPEQAYIQDILSGTR
jgi:hypothetical protein